MQVTFRQVAGPAGGCLADLGDRLRASRAALGSAAGSGSPGTAGRPAPGRCSAGCSAARWP